MAITTHAPITVPYRAPSIDPLMLLCMHHEHDRAHTRTKANAFISGLNKNCIAFCLVSAGPMRRQLVLAPRRKPVFVPRRQRYRLPPYLPPPRRRTGFRRFLWPALAVLVVLSAGSLGLLMRDTGPQAQPPLSAERLAAIGHCRALIAEARAGGTYGRDEMARLLEVCRRAA